MKKPAVTRVVDSENFRISHHACQDWLLDHMKNNVDHLLLDRVRIRLNPQKQDRPNRNQYISFLR